MSKSYIYVLSNGSVSKIGITTCPYSRLAQIRYETGEDYTPVRLWECNESAAYKFEKDVIKSLSPHCVKGREWFGVPSWTAVSTITRLATARTGLRPVEWPTGQLTERVKITTYLEPEQIAAIDTLRAMSKRPRDRNKEIRGLLWSALISEPTKVGQGLWDKFQERTGVARLKEPNK